ncbi:Multiple organellar RNA editing factor 2-chloroplastic [Striga hermonthica]|uniref:Multiple organellar RNA editing factor 2-chloroplastic n=1 Tax=Striga hermonthica TaxID=68872 RepID=A0A9N7MKA8_STRHE|nr:Multiple organellar RNA editing factor 2-chloroplastic [Striga hermonthica]
MSSRCQPLVPESSFFLSSGDITRAAVMSLLTTFRRPLAAAASASVRFYVTKPWFVRMDNAGGPGASKEQMLDIYVKTLAAALGSEELAKKKIVKFHSLGFKCEIDPGIAAELKEFPTVRYVSPCDQGAKPASNFTGVGNIF